MIALSLLLTIQTYRLHGSYSAATGGINLQMDNHVQILRKLVSFFQTLQESIAKQRNETFFFFSGFRCTDLLEGATDIEVNNTLLFTNIPL